MFCSNCGKEISPSDKFCRFCGQKIQESGNEEEQYDVETVVNEFKNNRIGACKYLANMYGLSLSKAKELIDNEYSKRKKDKNIWKQAKQQIAEKNLHQQKELNKIKQLKEDKVPFCPRCHSTNLTAQKKGLGLLKGAIGVATFGGLGVTAAGIGKNKIILTCLNCGYQFKPGKKG